MIISKTTGVQPCGWCVTVVTDMSTSSDRFSVLGAACVLIADPTGHAMLISGCVAARRPYTTPVSPRQCRLTQHASTTVLDAALQSNLRFTARVLQAASAPNTYYVQLVAHCAPGTAPSTASDAARLLHAHLEPMHRPLPVRSAALLELALPSALQPTIDAAHWRCDERTCESQTQQPVRQGA